MTSSARGTLVRLLVIDDDPGMHTLVQDLVANDQIQVIGVKTLVEGVQIASQQRIDVILLDHLLPDGDGIDRIAEFISQDRLRPILYITSQTGSKTAIEAIKRGAFEYLSKPVDFSLLKQRIAEAIEYRRLTRLPVLIGGISGQGPESDILVGRCRGMQDVYKSIGRLASLRSPILIEGEVGTGKEMIARAIHQHGPRGSGPFHKVSTFDFDELSFQKEIFSKSGKLFHCHGGTLMLEEIQSWSMATQSRFLRFFQDGKIEGDNIDTRVIMTTSIPSRELVQSGKLRSDLYYTLSPFMVRVPALRDRQEDFELLVSHFMQRLAQVSSTHQSVGPARVSPVALQLLKLHDWPGNVAELKSVLQSVLMESHGAVLATDALMRSLELAMPRRNNDESAFKPAADNISNGTVWDLRAFVAEQIKQESNRIYDEAIAHLDQQLIGLLMEHTKGNRVKAAKLLGITRTSLRRKMHPDKNALPDDETSDSDGDSASEST